VLLAERAGVVSEKPLPKQGPDQAEMMQQFLSELRQTS
jgi:hypothetical protein